VRPWIVLCLTASAWAQAPRRLTLDEAEQLALRNHPRIASAALNVGAAEASAQQARAAYQPQLTANLTSAGADHNTAIGAGALQTSGLSSRVAMGFGVSQLLTDFGRTSQLEASARFRASAQEQNLGAVRAQVLLQVDQAYYAVLAADSVLQVARARLGAQRLTLRQVEALAASSMKSTLDVSFAQVAVSEAELALSQAENAARANRALLAAAMGEGRESQFDIADVPAPGPLLSDADALVQEALANRPDLAASRLSQSAAERFADAERRLRFPTFSLAGTAGSIPAHPKSLDNKYAAAGVNISLPLLNGGAFAARRAEAEYRARAAEKDVEGMGLQVATAVRVAWIEADNAWRRIEVTARLLEQTSTALRLATTRYEIGLSGILELTQSQLALTSAQIAAAGARYEYLSRLAAIKYASGGYR
jgi:outer membrane protein